MKKETHINEITIRLNEDINAKLENLSKKIGVPKHSLIIIIIFNYLDNSKIED